MDRTSSLIINALRQAIGYIEQRDRDDAARERQEPDAVDQKKQARAEIERREWADKKPEPGERCPCCNVIKMSWPDPKSIDPETGRFW